MSVKSILTAVAISMSMFAKAQKVENIFVNLYTDSLKKGTYNYINVDGLLSNGKYVPLDSNHIIFRATEGKFNGNSLWLDKDFDKESVLIKVELKDNPKMTKEFRMYIKKKPDDEKLPTTEEILKTKSKKKKNKK
ncbi:MAG: hypothetical protein JWN83_934 [Chitinophagaceae bacterium]|nr:hypothetical protein [Chitinophagaceae bacterium]